MSSFFSQYNATDNYQKAMLGRNGHHYSSEAKYGLNDVTYYWFEVTADAVVSYYDSDRNYHTSITMTAGSQRDCSGVPTVESGTICAWIDNPELSKK